MKSLLLLCLLTMPALAGQWDPNPEVKNWFYSLTSKDGFKCCGYEDGIQDPPYKENEDGSYEVFFDGEWKHADQQSIVNPPDRKVQYAIVWKQYGGGVRCFMPGTGY